MRITRQSYLSNLVGKNAYEAIQQYAKFIVPIGTCVLLLLYMLSSIVHLSFISTLINACTGTSLLFIAYIISLLFILDVQVDVLEEDLWYKPDTRKPKPLKYKFTIAWTIILSILCLSAIYFSNEYRIEYRFKCDTFLVDQETGIYHLDWDNDCEEANKAADLIKMKGYEIRETNYELCQWCMDWASEAEMEYNVEKYIRR